MHEVEFRISGFSEADGRFRRRSRRPPKNSLAIVALGAIVVVLVRGGQPNATARHAALVHGKEVKADRVLVLLDNSRSMAGTDPEVQLQLGRLAAGGVAIEDRATIPGFAISWTSGLSLLRIFNEHIAAHPHVDTIYVISDFHLGDNEENEAAAYEDFARTLRDRCLRLYWATVHDDPPPDYYALARRSGGDVIPVK